MTSSPAADAATAPEHTDGPACPACPTHTIWIEHHCYGCGKAYDAETAALLHRALHSESLVEQTDAYIELNTRPINPARKDCLR